ncbi:AraC family transcriptional regulator [Streptomyces hyderabadensis]|uniref:AraC family transcriptional regulator n=1 Tax=Streptomyces hyderabadensis TaxID=598549 RepID=A0ABP9HSM1_9ACTN
MYGFQPPVGTPFGLEVNTVEDFFAQHDDWPWSPPRPGRATFHYLIGVTEGELLHDVDHLTRTVAPGQWLWVRPGHTQCWHPPGTARGPFILFEPGVLAPGTARLLAPLTAHDASAVLSPHPDDAVWLRQTALQLLDEHRALGRRPLDVHHALRRSLLEALLLRLANAPGITPTGTATAGPGCGDTYGGFADALELHFRELHRAADYAELLGCSVRTLSRAARDATGKGVRHLIDERRLLEARRLLGHARWEARAVAAHLGFSDPANFGRFFRDRTGLTPAAFAARDTTTGP